MERAKTNMDRIIRFNFGIVFLGLISACSQAVPISPPGYNTQPTANGFNAQGHFALVTQAGATYDMSSRIQMELARDDVDRTTIEAREVGGDPVSAEMVEETGTLRINTGSQPVQIVQSSSTLWQYNGNQYYSQDSLMQAVRDDPAIRSMAIVNKAGLMVVADTAEQMANDPAVTGHRAAVGKAIAGFFRALFNWGRSHCDPGPGVGATCRGSF